MRMVSRMVLAVGAVVLLGTPAMAQRGGGGFGMGGGMLLSNKGVQQELKLDASQTEKVNKFVEESRAKRQEQFQALQGLSQEERQAKMPEIMRAANEETQKALKGMLKPEQITRFNQISLQQQGVMAFADPQVVDKLKLTPDQTQQVKDVADSFRTESREIFQSNQDNREEAMKQMTALRKSKMDKVSALLTADQKKTWKEMTGEPFEVKFEPRPGQ
jgi:Spy/CpxP family protein refolding chaperone